MPVFADRVKETTTTTGTGTLSLLGAVVGFRTFVDGVGDGSTVYYCITDDIDWEVGLGTVTDGSPDTLSRTTIYASSNGGAAVSWGAGTKQVFLTQPAHRANALPFGGDGADGSLTVPTGTVTEITTDKRYTTLVLEGSGILAGTADRVLDVRAYSIDLQSTSKISMTGRGPAGRAGGAGSDGGNGTQPAAGNAGVAGNTGWSGYCSPGGGGGGGGGGGTDSSAGSAGGAGGTGAHRAALFDGLGGGTGGAGGTAPSFAGTNGSNSGAISDLDSTFLTLLSDILRTFGLPLAGGGPGGGGGGGSGSRGPGGSGAGTGGAGGAAGSRSGSSGFGAGAAGGTGTHASGQAGGGAGGGSGGAGGGAIRIEARKLTIASGARIEANGAAGGPGTNSASAGSGETGGGSGGGGGGGGGFILVLYETGTNVDSTRCTVSGGTGGTGSSQSPSNYLGGGGGTGATGGTGVLAIRQVIS